MITHTNNAPQGSLEWLNARAGKISASMFSTARGKLKKTGEMDAAARSYAMRCALERIGGKPMDDGVETYAMKRGRELEPVARDLLAKEVGAIEQTGFITDEYDRFGCSPDGLIGVNGGCEIKCLISPDRIGGVLLRRDLSDFMDQIQGCMWVTGRSWWMFALYMPQLASAGKDLFSLRVERDEAYIISLEQDLEAFHSAVCGMEITLRNSIPTRSQEPF